MSSLKPVFVVAGIGNGTGTGGASARVFAKAGYSIALISRRQEPLDKLVEEIKKDGTEALSIPVASYSTSDLNAAFTTLFTHYPPSTHTLRVALFNAADTIFKPFLSITPSDLQRTLSSHVEAAFAFAQVVIRTFKENEILEVGSGSGSRGTLIFTGATASLRGGPVTSAFAAAKGGVRALSQSLAKEFGRENIHVSHAIIDGRINTGNNFVDLEHPPSDKFTDESNDDTRLSPEEIGNSYLYLVNQHRSAWTWELDLRPAHEKW